MLVLNVWLVFISLKIRTSCELREYGTESAGSKNGGKLLQNLSEYRDNCTDIEKNVSI